MGSSSKWCTNQPARQPRLFSSTCHLQGRSYSGHGQVSDTVPEVSCGSEGKRRDRAHGAPQSLTAVRLRRSHFVHGPVSDTVPRMSQSFHRADATSTGCMAALRSGAGGPIVGGFSAAARSVAASGSVALQAVESMRVLAEDLLACDLGLAGFERLR